MIKQTMTFDGDKTWKDLPRMGYAEFNWWLNDIDDQHPRKPPAHQGNYNRAENGASRYRWYLSRIRHFDVNRVPHSKAGRAHDLYGHDHYQLEKAIGEITTTLEAFASTYLRHDDYEAFLDFHQTIQRFFEWFSHPTFAEAYDMADKLLAKFEHKEQV